MARCPVLPAVHLRDLPRHSDHGVPRSAAGAMNILLLASHAVAEYDDLRMFTDLGFDVFAPGGYEVPSRSGEGIRPALPDAPHHPELVSRLNDTRERLGEPGPAIDWGK